MMEIFIFMGVEDFGIRAGYKFNDSKEAR